MLKHKILKALGISLLCSILGVSVHADEINLTQKDQDLLKETFTLNNGVKIPKIGLGTWLIKDQAAKDSVLNALKLGYRHIDSASSYGNEVEVGEAIRESGIPREEIFVTTKVNGNIKNYKDAKAAIDESLNKLNIGYIDLMLIHSPQPWNEFRTNKNYDKENLEVWKALEEAYTEGKIKAIGVSNFLESDIDNILKNAKIKPAVNQILTHIANTPLDLIEYCKSKDILVEAYSPIAHGEVLKSSAVKEIADHYQKSVPQLCLRYALDLDLVVLPKTSNVKHMVENAKLDFKITKEDLETLKHMKQIDNYGDSSFFPVFGGSTDKNGKFVPGKPHKK